MSQAQVEADIKSWTGRQYDMIIDIPQLVILPEEEPTMQWHCYLNQRFKPILMNYLPQLDCRQKQKPKAAAVASIVADQVDKPQHQVEEQQLEEETMKEIKHHMDSLLQDRNRVVSFIGHYGKGKTFVMNQLAGTSLPSGFRPKDATLALNFLLPPKTEKSVLHNHVFIDTAGIDGPALDVSDPKLKGQMLARDKLIKDVVVALSTDIVLVTTELTWSDQELIKFLSNELEVYNKRGAGTKCLYVVHNFNSVSTERDLLEKWQVHVVNTHPNDTATVKHRRALEVHPKPKTQDRNKTFTPCISHKDGPKHFLIGNAESQAGQAFNVQTLNVLQDLLNKGGTEGVPKLTMDNLIDTLFECLKKYLLNPTAMKLQFDATPAKVAQLVNPKISHKEQPSYANLSTDASVWEQKLKVQDSQLSAYLNLFKLVVKGEKLDLAPQLSAISHEDYKEPQHMVQFVPQHDIIEKDDGLHIIIELPEYDADDNSSGKIEAICLHERDQGILSITGIRPHLQYCSNPFDEQSELELKNYEDLNADTAHSRRERRTGNFTLKVSYNSADYLVNKKPVINIAGPGCVQVSVMKKPQD